MSDKINACDDETYDFGFPVLFFLSKSVLPNLLAVLFLLFSLRGYRSI